MSEAGFDASIPVWDGRADSLREFKKLVVWWLESIDLKKTANFSLAARFAIKQKGADKLRALEFEPAELAHQPEVWVTDEEGNSTQTQQADYAKGINKILEAWDEMIGQTVTDNKGELRERFYMQTKRANGEGVVSFALKYRTLVAEMKKEGIALDDAEAAWFFKQKLMLTEVQMQMLETTLGPDTEKYSVCEREAVRLFKRLHMVPMVNQDVSENVNVFGSRPGLLFPQVQLRVFLHPGPAG